MEIRNKKAFFNYEVGKSIEAGIVLNGSEIKSVRKGSVDLGDAFVTFKGEEAFVTNMFIAKYKEANQFNHDERRARKLLLHKSEIRKLIKEKTLTQISVIPIRMYIKDNKVKLEIAVCKGKKLYDKREAIKKRDLERREGVRF